MLQLYPRNQIDFTWNGEPIRHTYDEHVVRDDGWYLSFKVLLDEEKEYKKLKKGMVVKGWTMDGEQAFRIWDITKGHGFLEVEALHLIYDLDTKMTNPIYVNNGALNGALTQFKNGLPSEMGPFIFSTGITKQRTYNTEDAERANDKYNAMDVFMDGAHSIVGTWEAELLVNNWDIRLVESVGNRTGALLYEKKNISEFEDVESNKNIITRIYAQSTYTPEREEGADEEPQEVHLSVVAESPLINDYEQVHEAIYINNDARTVQELSQWAMRKFTYEKVDLPERTIKVSTNIIDGTEINFGDYLVLKYLTHDVEEEIRCVGYDVNPVTKDIYEINLGTNKLSMQGNIGGTIKDLTESQLSNEMAKVAERVTKVIMASNGYNRIAYGPEPVPSPIEGDLWYEFQFDTPKNVTLKIWKDGMWVILLDDFMQERLKEQLNEVKSRADDIEKDVKDANDRADTIEQDFQDKIDSVNDELFEDGESILDRHTNQISETKTNADNALTGVGDVKTDILNNIKPSIETAKSIADEAKSNADNAVTEAGEAKEYANQAVTSSEEAVTKANSALTEAGEAKEISSEAKTDAQTAVANASQALSDVTTALDNSENAVEVSNEAKVAVGIAKEAVSQAVLDAEKALDDANNALIESGEAKQDASQALIDAQKAVSDATDALSMVQGFETDVQQALSDASTALQNASQLIIDLEHVEDIVESNSLNIERAEDAIALKANQVEVDSLESWVKDLSVNESVMSVTWYKPGQQNATWMRGENPDMIQSYTLNELNALRGNPKMFRTNAADILSSIIRTNNASIELNSKEIALKADQTEVDVISGRVTDTETSLTVQATEIASKANQTELDTLNGTVEEHGTSIIQNATAIESKASQSSVDTLTGTVSEHSTSITQNATAITSKADRSDIEAIEGVIESHSTEISQNATDITSKADITTVDTLSGTVSEHGTQISQNATNISFKASQSDIDAIEGRVTDAETSISINAREIASKASQTDLNTLSGTVESHETSISQNATDIILKADKVELDTLSGTVSEHTTSIGQNAQEIALKANQSDVDTINSTVNEQVTSITQNAQEIALKAAQSEVDTLTGRVNTAESELEVLPGQIALKANQTDVDSIEGWVKELGSNNAIMAATWNKANSYDIEWRKGTNPEILRKNTLDEVEALKGSPNMRRVNAVDLLSNLILTNSANVTVNSKQIELKANQTELDLISGIVEEHGTSITQNATEIESKASQSSVDTLAETISGHSTSITQNATAITSKADQSTLDALAGTVSNQGTQISQNATDISLKASRTDVDTIEGRVTDAESSISIHAEEIASKADKSEVDTLAGTVSSHGTLITQNANEIESKASQSSVDTLAGSVSEHSTSITQNATDITSKADKSDIEVVEGVLETHSTQINQNATDITSKAEQATVDTLSGTVATHSTQIGQNATSISLKADSEVVDTLSRRVESTESELEVIPGQISLKANQTEVDTIKETLKEDVLNATIIGVSWNKAEVIHAEWNRESEPTLLRGNTKAEINKFGNPNMQRIDDTTTMTQIVSTAYAEIILNTEEISTKLNRQDVEQLVDDKGFETSANVTTITNAINQRISDAESSIESKITLEEVESEIDSRGYETVTSVSSKINAVTQRVSDTETSLETILGDYLKETDINGMVTETILENKGYATSSEVSQTLASYYTSGAIDSLLDDKADTSDIPSLDGYATVEWTQNQSYATSSEVSTTLQSYVKDIDIEGMVTTEYLKNEEYQTASEVRQTLTGYSQKTDNMMVIGVYWDKASSPSMGRLDPNTLVGKFIGENQTKVTEVEQTLEGFRQSVEQNYVENDDITDMVTTSYLNTNQYQTATEIGTTLESYLKTENLDGEITETTAYQTVKETTDRYERVIGSTDAESKSNIAQIVMSDSAYQTSVANFVDNTSTQWTQLADGFEALVNEIGDEGEKITSAVLTSDMFKVNVQDEISLTITEDLFSVKNNAELLGLNNLLSNTSLKPATSATSDDQIAPELARIDTGLGYKVQYLDVLGTYVYMDAQTYPKELTFKLNAHVSQTAPLYIRGDFNGKVRFKFPDGNWSDYIDGVTTKKVVLPTTTGEYTDEITMQVASTSFFYTNTLMMSSADSPYRDATENLTSAEITQLAGKTLIKNDLIYLDGNVYMDKAFIGQAIIDNLQANHVTSFMGTFSELTASYIDVNKLSGNAFNFISGAFNSPSSRVDITGNGLDIIRNDGSRVIGLDDQGIDITGMSGKKMGHIGHLADGGFGEETVGVTGAHNTDLIIGYQHTPGTTYTPAIKVAKNTGNINVSESITFGQPVYMNSTFYLGSMRMSGGTGSVGGVSTANLSFPSTGGQLRVANGDLYVRSSSGDYYSFVTLWNKAFS